MIKRGPKFKPAKIHQLHGTFRKDRQGGELNVTSILPDPPPELSGVGLEEWHRMAPELHKLGVLTALDVTLLHMYCTVFARWINAEKKIKEIQDGEISTTPNGYQQQSAWLTIANQCVKQTQSLCAEFGLSPATRARLRFIEERPKQMDLLKILDSVSKQKAEQS